MSANEDNFNNRFLVSIYTTLGRETTEKYRICSFEFKVNLKKKILSFRQAVMDCQWFKVTISEDNFDKD